MQSRDDQRAESADGDESTESDDLLVRRVYLPYCLGRLFR